MKKKLIVECPKCKTKFNYHDSKYRPFCTKRCKMVDLGKWLNDEYSLKGESIDVENLETDDEDE